MQRFSVAFRFRSATLSGSLSFLINKRSRKAPVWGLFHWVEQTFLSVPYGQIRMSDLPERSFVAETFPTDPFFGQVSMFLKMEG